MRGPIWDVPTRLFHWALVLLIAAAWWTAENDEIEWHVRAGMAVFMLLVFRLVWGVIGGSTARFGGFIKGPRAILTYLRGRYPSHVGHNPLGALSVIALLAAVAAIVGLGLVGIDEDGIAPGPLSHLVSDDLAEVAIELHEHEAFDALLVLVVLHVTAILFYAVAKRQNLIRPMVTGSGEIPAGVDPLRPAGAWRAAMALLTAFAAAWWIWTGAPL
jgi:cytochrome b